MSLTELEQHVFAYFVGGDANTLNIAPRFYPYGELILIFEDKVAVATRKFGIKVKGRAKMVAQELIDQLIASGAYSTKQNEFGGTMHQFQGEEYRSFLKQQIETNPIILKAKAASPEFWEQAFAGLTS